MEVCQKVLLVNNVLNLRPIITSKHLKNIATEVFGLEVSTEQDPIELDSYEDRNFLLTGKFFLYTSTSIG